MPDPECFLDTNILLYAVSTGAADIEKIRIAQDLLQSARWAWSAQVAAEFIRAGTSPRQPVPLTRQKAGEWIKRWMAFPMVAVDGKLVLEALAIAERYQTSYFDAQILAAARRLRCPVLYTEDLNHEQDYGGVQVLNPFLRT